MLAATADDRVTSKRPKNKPVILTYPGSEIEACFMGGHLSGLKSNRPYIGVQGPMNRTTCRHSLPTAVLKRRLFSVFMELAQFHGIKLSFMELSSVHGIR